MNLNDYRVEYGNYKNIKEPKIYIWEEEKTGRIIARVFNTGISANNCRNNYAIMSGQTINWCSGVFPVDFDKDYIKNWYPTVEFHDELIINGRKNKDIQTKSEERSHKIFIGAKIPQSLKNKIDRYSDSTGKNQSKVIVEALEKYLNGKDKIIEQIKELQKLL